MKDIKACFSTKTDDWKTPSDLYKTFMDLGYIDVAPYQSEEDYLKKEFHNSKLFCNPPYSNIKKFVEWLLIQRHNNNNIWLLIPARTDTQYFKMLYNEHCNFYFINKRLHFNDSKLNAPFPSVLVQIAPFMLLPYMEVVTKQEFIDFITKDERSN